MLPRGRAHATTRSTEGTAAGRRKNGPIDMDGGDSILQSCVTDFFMDPSFQKDIDTFIENNCKLFHATEIYLEDNTGGVELENVGIREHTHEHMDCFQRFTALFDTNLDQFLQSKNVNKRKYSGFVATAKL